MFIEITHDDGEKSIINTDGISTFSGTKDGTRIYFTDGGEITVKESYEEIRKTLNVHGILR